MRVTKRLTLSHPLKMSNKYKSIYMYVCIHTLSIYIYIHTYTICILSAFILYFCGISNFRCMLRVPRGTVTKISKNKKKIVLFLPLLSVQTGGVRTLRGTAGKAQFRKARLVARLLRWLINCQCSSHFYLLSREACAPLRIFLGCV